MTNGGRVDGNASVRTPRAGGGAGTSRTEPKEMEAGGPQRVAAWVDAQGGARRSASLPFVLVGTNLSGTLQGVDGAAGASRWARRMPSGR